MTNQSSFNKQYLKYGLIVGMLESNRGIGNAGNLPWPQIPRVDMALFKHLTSHAIAYQLQDGDSNIKLFIEDFPQPITDQSSHSSHSNEVYPRPLAHANQNTVLMGRKTWESIPFYSTVNRFSSITTLLLCN